MLERLIGLLIPPACREEILGDLHERYQSLPQYLFNMCSVTPMVIVSRIRRTADPQVLLLESFALYLAFLGATLLQDRTFLLAENALLRLALPCATTLVGALLEAAYTRPGRHSQLQLARGPALGIFAALLCQEVLRYADSDAVVPQWIMLNGSAMGLLLLSGIRFLFPPVTTRPSGAAGPAYWLKQAGEPVAIAPSVMAVLRCLAAFSAVAIVGAWTGSALLVKVLTGTVAAALVIYELNRRI
jgi:hypothetical protein